jgi:hypothetical protein
MKQRRSLNYKLCLCRTVSISEIDMIPTFIITLIIIFFQNIDLCLYYFLRIMYDFINFESNLKLKTKYCFSINNIHYHGHAILLYELFLTSLNIHALIYIVT